MEYNIVSFPAQKLPVKQKDEEWGKRCVDAIIGREYGFNTRHFDMKLSYDLVNSIFDEKDLHYVTNPYKVEDGFPAKLQNINIVRPKIELLKGEEISRHERLLVFQTDEAAIDALEEKKKQMLYEALSSYIGSEEDGQLEEELTKIQNYISRDYYNPAEQTANLTLKYLKEKLNLRDEFLKGWEDALIAGKEVYYTGIINGDPIVERANPLLFSHDPDPSLKRIEDGDWQLYRMLMTPAAIYDRFYDLMNEGDLDELLKFAQGTDGGQSISTGSNINTNYINYSTLGSSPGVWPYDEQYKGVFLNVYHAVWRSWKKVGFLTEVSEDGEVTTTTVDESYIASPDEIIKWDWINENWEGYRVGDKLYLGINPIEYQHVSIDNPNSGPLPYVGQMYNNNNTQGKSLVELMKPLQYMYIILWYRLELALARDKGKIFTADITQIPKSMGIDPQKWLHYLSSVGVMFVNPHEQGWGIPGREGGRASSFNQFSSIDLSMTQVIKEYIELMNKIEEMIGELCGVSKSRQGQIHQSSLVQNVRQEITQSSLITEPLFYRHNLAKRNVYNAVLNIAKHAWKLSGKKKIGHIFEGPERKFMDITEEFLYSDYDVFVSDAAQEKYNLETLKQLYQPAMQNGATLLDIATLMTANSISEIKTKLSEIEQNRAKLTQEMQEAEAAAAEREMSIKEEKNRIDEDNSVRQTDAMIQVALISAGAKAESDSMKIVGESDKIESERNKAEQERYIKERQLSEQERSNRAKEEISRSSKKSVNNK